VNQGQHRKQKISARMNSTLPSHSICPQTLDKGSWLKQQYVSNQSDFEASCSHGFQRLLTWMSLFSLKVMKIASLVKIKPYQFWHFFCIVTAFILQLQCLLTPNKNCDNSKAA